MTEFCAAVAHDLLHKKISPHSSQKQAPHGIYVDVLRIPYVFCPQTECCSAALVVMSVTTNVTNRCVRKVSKQELLFFMLICAIVDVSAPGLSVALPPHLLSG